VPFRLTDSTAPRSSSRYALASACACALRSEASRGLPVFQSISGLFHREPGLSTSMCRWTRASALSYSARLALARFTLSAAAFSSLADFKAAPA